MVVLATRLDSAALLLPVVARSAIVDEPACASAKVTDDCPSLPDWRVLLMMI
jgi:hypothetical protein